MACHRRRFLAALPAPVLAPALQRKGGRPNIILLLADDLGCGELGFQGNREIPTPHLDSIARSGVRFTQGYVSAPFCSPSRAGLMTGRYQTRFGHELNAIGKQNDEPGVGLPLTETTLADHLKAAGYATGLVGKWHLGGRPEFHPQRRGFDEFYGFLHEGHFFYPPPFRGAVTRLRVNEPAYDDGNPVRRGSQPVVEAEYLTDAFAREATAFVERHARQPFFLYLAFNAVHSPMQAPVPLVRRFDSIRDEQRRVFAGMLVSMDDAVGRVVGKLRELGLEEDTLIFLLSDNGGPTAELTSSNEPMRGGKGQLWEGGIRVPFAVQWKRRIPAGGVFEQPVISLDILPTALKAAGVGVPERLDGVDLLPQLTGARREAPHDSLYWRYGTNVALRRNDWKIVRQAERRGEEAAWRMFDLRRDPGETRDVSVAQGEEFRRLRREVESMGRQMMAPLWGHGR
jgi:arylsulfatase B